MKNIICLTTVAVCSFLATAAPRANATLLPANSSVTPNPQSSPFLGAALLADTGALPFSVSTGGSSIAGTAETWVVKNNPGDIYGANFLTFVFQVSLTSGTSSSGAGSILQRISDAGFVGALADAGYTTATGTVIPGMADRSSNGDVVAFDFLPLGTSVPQATSIGVGDTTDYLIINTASTQFTSSALSVDGTLSTNVASFRPVPEPSSLVAAGIAGIGLLARRRRASTTV